MINKIKNKKLITFIISFLIYTVLCSQKVIVPYNILSILIFIIMYYGIYQVNLDHKYKKEFTIISLILSLLLILGRILYNFRYNPQYNSLLELLRPKSIIYLLGISGLIYVIFSMIIIKMINYKSKDKFKLNHAFRTSFFVIIIVYLFYYIIYYPGLLTNDSLSEINMLLKNIPLSDHHTVFHIVFLAIPFKIANIFTNNINICIGAITLFQIIIMALILAYSISYLNKKSVPKCILIGTILYFALLPINGFYSITMWKDIIFSLLVLLLTIECQKLIENKNNLTLKNSMPFVIISILVVLARNNAIYMYLIFSIITIIVFRKKIATVLAMLLIIYGSYIVVKGPIYNYLNIKKSSSSEYIAIPLQQIGRMAYKGVEFNDYEEKELNKLIPISHLKEVYNPEIVDSIKFDKEYNENIFEKNKAKYFKIWLGLCLKNPQIAVESYLTSILGYWYPGVEYWVVIPGIDNNNLGIKTTSIIPNRLRTKFNKIMSSNIPIIGFTKCIGLCIWLIFILAYVALKRKNKQVLYSFVPVIGIWLTMLLATPVFAEFRYIYSAYLCLPIFVGMIYFK